MLYAPTDHVCFTAEGILEGLRYHFRELGICVVLEEALVELIERKMAQGCVYFKHEIWQVFTGDLERAMILLDLAKVTREELQASPQGRQFLALEEAYAQANGEQA